MLQRSPSYVVSLPAQDRIANGLRRWLPQSLAHGLTRWKNVLLGMIFVRLSKRSPDRIRKLVLDGVRRQLGPDYDIATHFTPRYNPWDQRLCVARDADLFKALNSGRASVVTDHIDSFTADGIQLKSGEHLAADLIVTATGLNLVMLGGIQLSVDGRRVDLSQTMNYKGVMYSDVPNLAAAVGYTNASWTLKCDLTCEYVCRLLNYMDERGLQQCTPRNRDPAIKREPLIDLSSGYVQRVSKYAPKQGSRAPWRLHQNYALDLLDLKFGSLADAAMEFSNAATAREPTGALSLGSENRSLSRCLPSPGHFLEHLQLPAVPDALFEFQPERRQHRLGHRFDLLDDVVFAIDGMMDIAERFGAGAGHQIADESTQRLR